MFDPPLAFHDVAEFGGSKTSFGEFLRAVSDIDRVSLLLDGVSAIQSRGKERGVKHFLKASPALESRVAAQVKLKPMTVKELRGLIERRISHSSNLKTDQVITRKAIERIHQISEGNPRKALKAASKSLNLAMENGVKIKDEIVCKANEWGWWKKLLAKIG